MIFVQRQYAYLVPALQQKKYHIVYFENQERQIQLEDYEIQGAVCTVVGSLTVCPEQVIELFILLHTISLLKPKALILFSPYLGYQRQEKFVQGKSWGMDWAFTMLKSVGVSEIITLEPHFIHLPEPAIIPIKFYQSDMWFDDLVVEYITKGFHFLFPDQGAYIRHNWLVRYYPDAYAGYFTKYRNGNAMSLGRFHGIMAFKIIIYDDILDSGVTMRAVCQVLQAMGVQEIVIFVTHAFFHGSAWQELWDLGVQVIYCTNSLPHAQFITSFNVSVKSIDFCLQNL
jgi:ribose-phosphate pyrophosphokinase